MINFHLIYVFTSLTSFLYNPYYSVHGGRPLSSSCDTSTFQMTYGGNSDDQILDLISAPGDNAICAGKTNSFGNGGYDAWIFKTDKTGNVVWSKTYGGPGDDFFKRIIQTNDGGYLAGGVTSSFTIPQGQAFAVKTDAAGNVQWAFILNVASTYLQAMWQTNDGGYALLATVAINGSASRIIVIKVAADGSMQWMKQYFSSDSDFGDCIKQSNDGNLIVTGFTHSFGLTSHDCYLMKVSIKDGSVIWMKTFGSPGDDVIDWVAENAQGDLFLSADWNNQAALFKTDQNGNIIWGKSYAWSGYMARGYNLALTSDGGFILGVSDEVQNGAILKLDQSGNIIWDHQYTSAGGTVNMEYPVSELASHTGFFVGGYTNGNSNNNNNDAYLIKTDEQGNTGTCKAVSPDFITANINPSEEDHSWTVSPVAGWQAVSIKTGAAPVTRKVICPQCCVSSNTTVDTAICQGETYKLPDDSVVNQAGTYAVKFTSSTGCDSIITTHLTINPAYHITVKDSICPHQPYTLPDGKVTDTAGTYVSSLHTYKGCDSIITTDLSFKGPVNIQYPDSICEGTSLILPNGTRVTEPGDYTVDLPSATGCDTLAVYHVFMKYPPVVHLNGDTCLIAGQSMWLHAGDGYRRYEWQDGSTDSTMHVSDPGTYWVKVSNSCGSVTDSAKVTNDCLPDIYVPSAFTPNGDGMNDVFRILNVHGQKLILFNIYNRWGKTVFHTANISLGWDGSFKGNPQPIGAYVYLIKIINLAGQEKVYKGSVVLIR